MFELTDKDYNRLKQAIGDIVELGYDGKRKRRQYETNLFAIEVTSEKNEVETFKYLVPFWTFLPSFNNLYDFKDRPAEEWEIILKYFPELKEE